MLKYFKKHRHRILLIIGLILGTYRLRYFIGSNIPLGYDPGMYKKIFETYNIFFQTRDFSIFPYWMKHEPFLPFLVNIFHGSGISYDRLVTRGIGICSLLPGIWLFLIFRKQNKLLAVLTPLLYRISITQYEVFRRNYFKQILGVNIMLGTLRAFGDKKSLIGSIGFLLLLITHRHTALYTGGILVLWFMVQTIQTKKIPRKQIGILGGVGALALIVYIPMRDKLINDGLQALKTLNYQGYGGMFITRTTYNIVTLPVIIISLLGLFLKFKNKKIDIWLLGYLIGIIRVGLGLVNFNRTLVFFDLFVIILGAYGLKEFIKYHKKIGRGITGIVFIYSTYTYLKYINIHAQPLINQEQFNSIASLDSELPASAIIMVTDKYYTARIVGYSNRERISPGWSEINAWSNYQRQLWRNGDGKIKCAMLKDYKELQRPIYLRLGSHQRPENLVGQNCLQEIEQTKEYQLWRYQN